MKQSLYLGKSYLIANALIGVNRDIIDDKDVKNVEIIVKDRLKQNNFDVLFFDDVQSMVDNEIITKQTKASNLYVKLPWITKDELKNKYRENLPFGLSHFLEAIDNNELLERDQTESIILKNKAIKCLADYQPVNKQKPKKYKKEYRISER